jgi:hypothetical protein
LFVVLIVVTPVRSVVRQIPLANVFHIQVHMLVLILAASPEKVVAVLIPAVLMGLKFVVLMVRVGASDRVHVV